MRANTQAGQYSAIAPSVAWGTPPPPPPAAWAAAPGRPLNDGFVPLHQPPAQKPSCLQRSICCLAVTAGVLYLCALFFAYFCHYLDKPRTVHAQALVQRYFAGRPTFNYWDLPVQRSDELLADCVAQLEGVVERIGSQWGAYPANKAPFLAYRCTKVPGLFEKVPAALRGVFWMHGNAIPEELAVLQMGQYFPEERLHLAPMSPFSWAWPLDTPLNAPYDGRLYTDEAKAVTPGLMAGGLLGATYKFKECPGSMDLPFPFGLPGHVCPGGTGGAGLDLTFAELQMHTFGNLTAIAQPDLYTIEEYSDGSPRGATWHRGIYGGPEWLGRCKCISVGAYTLKKLVDGEGQPVEPHYSEWVEYMGGGRVSFWGGFVDEAVKSLTRQGDFAAAAERMMRLWEQESGQPAAI
mmetsp:Transcript_87163/g.251382  ORF Transcript_87163/g.251382 Transcript_87163/m.251382 type:complete len:407 (+) Transcript_87163:119-1339(+)